jgi:hypothetical protein
MYHSGVDQPDWQLQDLIPLATFSMGILGNVSVS